MESKKIYNRWDEEQKKAYTISLQTARNELRDLKKALLF